MANVVWKVRKFRTHFSAQGFVNKISAKHVAVIEADGAGWRVAYYKR